MRKKVALLYVLALIFLVIYNLPDLADVKRDLSYFMLSESYLQISNPVTGIYLYYRVFDTLFEALLLLASVIGIIYFSRFEGDKDETNE